MNALVKAWNSLIFKTFAPPDDDDFREKYPDYDIPHVGANPRRPPTEEETYGGVPPDEHPLYGRPGFRGSAKKKPLPSMPDPKLVTQEKFDEEEPTLDTRTPPNPFTKAWYFLKAQPEHQIAGRGTAPLPIRGMMQRRRQLFTPEQMTPQPLDAEGRPHTRNIDHRSDYMDRDILERFEPTPEWLAHQREEPRGEEVSGRELRHVTRPVEPFREHLESMPEESFLTPSERWQAQQGLEANLRRNVGGQQRGGLMGPMRHKTNVEHGVARGMKLKPRVKQFEEKKPKLTAEQKEMQALDDMMAEMAAMTGGAVTHKPMEMPEPEPEPESEMGPAVGAVARRGSMDKIIRDAPVLVEGPMAPWEHPDPRMGPLENPKFDPNWAMTAGGKPRGYMAPTGAHKDFLQAHAHESRFDVDPRQAQAMAGGDMGEMDFGPEGTPMMGQEGLQQRLKQIANELAQQKARQKFAEPEERQPSSVEQAMQSEIDRRS